MSITTTITHHNKDTRLRKAVKKDTLSNGNLAGQKKGMI